MLFLRDIEAMDKLVNGPLDLIGFPNPDKWIEGDPGVGLDSEDEDDEHDEREWCPICNGTGREYWEPADPTKPGHWRDCGDCS